jgi:diguanylate cyclase (GGDEF)-like protein
MDDQSQPTFLLASNHPERVAALESVLLSTGGRVERAATPEAARAWVTAFHVPTLTLIDCDLAGSETEALLAEMRVELGHRFPVVLMCALITPQCFRLLAAGMVDDILPSSAGAESVDWAYWRLRLDMIVRAHRRMRELELLREATALNSQTDPLTGAYNRATLLAMLFRETDRVQRMNTTLCMILLDIDDFGHWNAELGTIACDDLLLQTVGRVKRLLRSYDLLGRVGKDEFLVALPGCNPANAVLLAERTRVEVFATPFHVAGHAVRLSACFGIAASRGRSPLVVLRDAEQALQAAKSAGPESIQCPGDARPSQVPPVAFFAPPAGDDLLGW